MVLLSMAPLSIASFNMTPLSIASFRTSPLSPGGARQAFPIDLSRPVGA